jgi:hypothetical protein
MEVLRGCGVVDEGYRGNKVVEKCKEEEKERWLKLE